MPFDSRDQQQWYNATDQDYLDDEPSSSRKVEEDYPEDWDHIPVRGKGGTSWMDPDEETMYHTDDPKAFTPSDLQFDFDDMLTGYKSNPDIDFKAEEQDLYENPSEDCEDYEDCADPQHSQLRRATSPAGRSVCPTCDQSLEADDEEEDYDLFSMGDDTDPEEISQGKLFGKYMDNTGATSKYDLFDPYEQEEEMSEATEVFYKKYLKAVEIYDYVNDEDVDEDSPRGQQLATTPDMRELNNYLYGELDDEIDQVRQEMDDATDRGDTQAETEAEKYLNSLQQKQDELPEEFN